MRWILAVATLPLLFVRPLATPEPVYALSCAGFLGPPPPARVTSVELTAAETVSDGNRSVELRGRYASDACSGTPPAVVLE